MMHGQKNIKLCLVCWLCSNFETNTMKFDAEAYVRRVGFVVITNGVTGSRNILWLVCLSR